MTMQPTGTFKITSWNEQPYSEIEGNDKVTRVSVKKTYSGKIQGTGTLEYLMTYHSDGSASIYGCEYIHGQVQLTSGGRLPGSCVLQHCGVFTNGKINETSLVIERSRKGELKGLQVKGNSEFSAALQQEYPVTLDYDFA